MNRSKSNIDKKKAATADEMKRLGTSALEDARGLSSLAATQACTSKEKRTEPHSFHSNLNWIAALACPEIVIRMHATNQYCTQSNVA